MPSTVKKVSKLKPLPPSIQRLQGRSGLSTPPNSTPKTQTTVKAKARGSFQMQAKNWILTFPQCATEKQVCMDAITKSPFGVKSALVVQEKHADGHPHLHIALFLTDKLRTRDQHVFDFIAGKHGNYQAMVSPQKALEYLRKYDKTPLIYGELPTDKSSKGSSTPKSTIVAGLVASGCTLAQINEAEPGYMLLNKKKIEEYLSWFSLKKARDSLKPLKLPIVYSGLDTDTSFIIDWLNTNLYTSRQFKAKQLYLSSPPNHLKTSLIIKLSKFLRIYVMPMQEDFYDFYEDGEYDLCVIDEFRGQKTVQFLNHWLQGDTMNIRKKGSQCIKNFNIPTIILSNFTVPEVYTKVTPDKLASLQVRLHEVSLSVPLDLDKVEMVAKEELAPAPQLPGMVAPSKGDKDEEEEMNLCVSDDE